MNETYKSFSYKRYRKPARWFAWAVILMLAGVGVLAGNLYFGWFKIETKSDNVTLASFSFWTEESEVLENKGAAIQRSLDVKKQGKAGFVVTAADDKFAVVDNIDYYAITDGKKYTIDDIKIKVTAPEHKDAIEKLGKTFYDNFKVLCDQVEKLEKNEMTVAEIAAGAFALYNKLNAQVAEVDTIQESAQSAQYSHLILYANKQLLSLYMLASDTDETQFTTRLKNAACGVIFAYYEFSQSISA